MSIDTVPASADAKVHNLQPRRRSGPINILIVDDEPKNLTVLETILDNPSYRLVRAESADQALLALVDDEFALLILDIQMPGMSGFELAQMIKQRKKTAHVPIIFLTAYYNEGEHVLEGYSTGAVDYLHKPINPAILRSKVAVFADIHNKNRILLAEVIERRRAEEQLRELNNTLEQRVTERTDALVKARIDLNETGEQYRSLFEGSLDAIFSLDVDECFKSANPAALRLIARTIEELETIRFSDLCAPDQREAVGNTLRAAVHRQGFTIETAVITATGKRRNLFISGGPTIHDGHVVGISCIARDITERIKTEEVVRVSEARYRELIQALPAAVYTTDERGRITLYNQAAVALWGRDPKVGKDLWCGSWKIYRPDGSPLPLDECPMAVTLREGRAVRGEEIVIERPDGTKRHVLPHPEPMRNADGVVNGAINMLIDITDRKEAEKAVARLAAIVTSSDDAIIGKDLHGIVTSWNQGAERLFGYAAEEMIGQPVLRLIPPERHDEEAHILGQITQGKPINQYETIRLCKDGNELTVSLTVSPILSDGKIIGASTIIRDISEQKRVQNALRRSERNLSDFFDNASVGLHWVGPDGLIMKVNQTELDLLGYSREEYLGHHITEFHVDQAAIQNMLRCLTSGETLREYPARIRCKDGSVLDVLINSNALFEDGKFIHSRCFTRDITDRKQAEDALRERDRSLTTVNNALKNQTVALADANHELEKFSYSVSHDLRAPLRTIDAFSRILEEDHGPHMNDNARRSLSIVRKAAGQAGELIDDLLELSKLGRQGMTVRVVNMADLAREAADDLKIMQADRQIDLTIGDLPPCQGDPRFLKIVWVNLLTNAFKYSKNKKESRIEVGWMPDDTSADMVIYYVKDNGIGFNMKYAHKLFEVFQRLHRQEDFEGTGIGLAVVQRIVHRHDGRVWAEAKVDNGATFFVSLRKAIT